MAIESDDGLAFDIDALAATVIREEMEHGGVRLKTAAYLERTRIPITIDIGRGALHALEGSNFWIHDKLDVIKAHRRTYDQAAL
ncbi:hypothetical protein ACJKIH_21775 [Brucella pseudogrignonensis]|uniref:Uncharacterized protein n=1 Tax=Brucella anthropi TaxID=529 RepID=A0A656Z3J4_BRUAN|nr:hypothetical protein AB664_12050 [Brucella anthropi]